jgi:HEAT repeat protein
VSDPILLAELAAADPLRRRTALERLASTTLPLDGAAVAAVMACLATPLTAVQRRAADVLSWVEADARPVVAARLRAAIGSDDPRLRWGATYALGRLGIVEPAMIAPLLEALGQRDGDQRWAAADLITTCARAHPDLVMAALLGAITDHEPERRKMALYVLRDVAPTSCAVRDATIRSLRDPAVGVRFAALSALVRLDPLPPEACTLVLALVRDDPDAGFRRAALGALGHVGRGVSAALAALEAAVTSDDPGIRRAAQLARRRLAE